MSHPPRAGLLIEFSRPFTLLAPALGFASGAATAAGAAPRESWSMDLLLYPLYGLLMAAILNAASNALNQIYDLEIDRVNKPKRPLTSGRMTIREAWAFTWVAYALTLILAWFVVPSLPAGAAPLGALAQAGRHECFWIVAIAVVATWIYSAPPLRTKQHGMWAKIEIASQSDHARNSRPHLEP